MWTKYEYVYWYSKCEETYLGSDKWHRTNICHFGILLKQVSGTSRINLVHHNWRELSLNPGASGWETIVYTLHYFFSWTYIHIKVMVFWVLTPSSDVASLPKRQHMTSFSPWGPQFLHTYTCIRYILITMLYICSSVMHFSYFQMEFRFEILYT